jgi:heme O synthase-like polyprenyltransferase
LHFGVFCSVVLSAAAGFAMAPVSLSLIDFGVAMLGTSLTIASANAGNQAMEVEYDKLMQVTLQLLVLISL